MATTADFRHKNSAHLIDAPADKWGIWENRLHITDIFRELAIPHNSKVSALMVYDAIVKYCKENRVIPRAVSWSIFCGDLYADGDFVRTVVPLSVHF